MNRMVGWLALDGSAADRQVLQACPFDTPHWRADHHAEHVAGALAMSATQRFVTPECPNGLMPYRDPGSGCVINADAYLTNRERLCAALGSDDRSADVVLILRAYLAWGERCASHLAGHF